MDRYSFSGNGNILIRAGAAGSYNSIQYEAAEPIAYFTDVLININFAYLEKTPKSGVDLYAVSSKSSPSYLTVANIKTSESLQSLLYKKQLTKKKDQTMVENLSSEGGVLYLNISPLETLLSKIFIFDSNKVKMTGYAVDTINNTITGLADGVYKVFYSISKTSAATYFLDAPRLPNIAAEIHVKGNLDGTTGDMVLHLNALQLLTRPSLDFTSQTPFVDTLEFAVLSDKEAEVNYYA